MTIVHVPIDYTWRSIGSFKCLYVAEDEEIPIDTWQTNYRIRKARDRGGIPLTKGVMDDKDGTRA